MENDQSIGTLMMLFVWLFMHFVQRSNRILLSKQFIICIVFPMMVSLTLYV